MSEPARSAWWLGPAATLGALGLDLLGRTWRIVWLDTEERDAARSRGEAWVFALWHSRLLALTWAHRHRDVGVLISQHRDGELIARVVHRLGYRTARGSSTRGGSRGTTGMMRFAAEGRVLAVTPDGPRGPAERVKDGVVWLASNSGLAVVPVAAASRPEWTLRSWDGFRVPRPFARVIVGYGAPIPIPGELDAAGIERWRRVVEEALVTITRRVDARAAERT